MEKNMDIDKLIEELERADYGSKDLDLKVAMVNNPNLTDLPDYLAIWPSAYTTSVDAALGLVPEGRSWSIEAVGSFVEAYVWQKETWRKPSGNPPKEGRATSAPLALTIAALKAREALGECASIAADAVFNTPKDAPTDKPFDEINTVARSALKEE